MILNKVQAAVFDMDGLLLDTERICCHILTQVFKEYKQELSLDEYRSLIGLNSREVRLRIAQKLGPIHDLEPFVKLWKSRYFVQTVEKAAPVKQGVVALLEYLKQEEFPMAVATSTDHATAEKKLAKAGLIKYFSILVGGDQIEHSKPAPDIYLSAAENLGVDPLNCLAFEDSRYGVEAALNAGMQTIHIPDLLELPQDLLERCAGVYRDCGDFLNVFDKVNA